MFKAIFALLLTSVVALGDALPADRMPVNLTTPTLPWSWVGVQGGITNYTQSIDFKVDYGADNTGVNDVSGLLQTAINACANGTAIWLTNGTYKFTNTVTIGPTKHIVIRGNNTNRLTTRTLIWNCTPTNVDLGRAVFIFGASASGTFHTPTGTCPRGSNSMVLDSVAGLTAPFWGYLTVSNDIPNIVPRSDFPAEGCPTCFKGFQNIYVTNITGNTITFDQPLAYPITNQSSMSFGSYNNMATYCGIENLSITATNTIADNTMEHHIFFWYARNCWATNIIGTYSAHGAITCDHGIHCEIRDNNISYHTTYDSNARYGLQLTGVSSHNLLQNNIVNGHNYAIVSQQGSHFNVISYNFSIQGFGNGYPTDAGTKGGFLSHGDNANFNLWEGNICPVIEHDSFWGSNMYETDDRNWATRVSETNTTPLGFSTKGTQGLIMACTNRYHNSIGSILGDARDVGYASGYKFGYDNRDGVFKDTNTQYYAYIHGVYDRFDSSTTWNATNADHTIPSSYYLSSKPSFFQALSWPPIGPDVNTSPSITNYTADPIIPARADYYGVPYTNPPSPAAVPGLYPRKSHTTRRLF